MEIPQLLSSITLINFPHISRILVAHKVNSWVHFWGFTFNKLIMLFLQKKIFIFLFFSNIAPQKPNKFFFSLIKEKLFNLDILLLLTFFSSFSLSRKKLIIFLRENFFFMTFKSFFHFYLLTIDLSRQLFISFLSESFSKKSMKCCQVIN